MASTLAPSTPPRRKALKLATTFQFESISCPGIYLNDRATDVYLQLNVLGRRYVSSPLSTEFPLSIHEQFHVEKVFTRATDPFQLGEYLKQERVTITLIQNFEKLAETTVNLKEFLFSPAHQSPKTGKSESLLKEVLITRTPIFPGLLSPRLEFMSQTSIREVIAKPKKDKTPMVSNLLREGARKGKVRPSTSPAKRTGRRSASPSKSSTYKTPWNPPGNVNSTSSKNLLKNDDNRRPRSRSKSPSKMSTTKLQSPSRPHTAIITRYPIPEIEIKPETESLPHYMKHTISSRSKSPTRSIAVISPRRSKFAEPIVPIISSQTSRLANGIIRPDQVESMILESPTARKVYKEAMENARLNERLNGIKIPFDNSKSRAAWTSHGAFETGKTHREVFNSLLDNAYASLYDKLEA